jgi:hypothetical protein
MAKSIMYGVRSPENEGDFDRRPVVNNKGKKPGYDFGERPTRGMPVMGKVSVTYFGGKATGSQGNYVKQKKMQGVTGGQGRGKDGFGSPKGKTSSFSGAKGSANQKKGFGGQTTRQY